MKRIVCSLLTVIMILSMFSGCGGSASNNSPSNNSSNNQENNTANESQTIDVPDVNTNTVQPAEPPVDVDPVIPPVDEDPEKPTVSDLTNVQMNYVAVLNYLMVITEKIRQSSNSRLYLEEVDNALLNVFYPNAIDEKTETQIGDLSREINKMRMIDIKRERLAFIYNQNKAHALMSALPSPISILNVVQSKNPLKAVATVIYAAVDSAKSYESATYSNELQYLKDNWDLDDEMYGTWAQLNLDVFNYCQGIVKQYEIDGDYTLNQNMARTLVEWENNENVSRRIDFLINHQDEYKACGYYWLLLSRSYYEGRDYIGCVDAMDKYLEVQPRIFRRDVNMAKILPLVIASLSDKYNGEKLVEKELYYVQLLSNNVAPNDWASRYYSALTYIDLYANTNNRDYLQKAFNEAKTNVNEVSGTDNNQDLINHQLSDNKTYLADVKEETAPKNATSDEKKEIKNYNKMLKEVRKTELAPIDNALLINIKLMLDLASELNLPQNQLKSLDNMIHNNGSKLFLVDSIDANLWADKEIILEAPDVVFEGSKITIPANYVCAKSTITVFINGNKIESDVDWIVDSVKRKGEYASDFIVTYVNKDFKNVEYLDGDIVTVSIKPYEDYFDPIEVSFKTVLSKTLFITTHSFEKIGKP